MDPLKYLDCYSSGNFTHSLSPSFIFFYVHFVFQRFCVYALPLTSLYFWIDLSQGLWRFIIKELRNRYLFVSKLRKNRKKADPKLMKSILDLLFFYSSDPKLMKSILDDNSFFPSYHKKNWTSKTIVFDANHCLFLWGLVLLVINGFIIRNHSIFNRSETILFFNKRCLFFCNLALLIINGLIISFRSTELLIGTSMQEVVEIVI